MKKFVALMMALSFILGSCAMADAASKYKTIKRGIINHALEGTIPATLSARATLRQGGTKMEALDSALSNLNPYYNMGSSGVKIADPNLKTTKKVFNEVLNRVKK